MGFSEGARGGKMINMGMELPKGGKMINMGMELGELWAAMLVTVTPEEEDSEKIEVQVQLSNYNEERYLPPNTQLTLYSRSGKTLQSTQSRGQDNYIQLKPFKGKKGIEFSLGVSLGDINIVEEFEL